MPDQGPGQRYSVVATKATAHGKPVVENKHPGIAAKSTQALPADPTTANATAAQNIAIGEEMVIMLEGIHTVLVADLPAGAVVGDQVFIRSADNVLVNAGGAGIVKFGLISSIDATLGRALVNLNLKDVL
jgi:hypothetical protein